MSPGKKVSTLVTLQTRQSLNVFYDQSCTFRVMDWMIQFDFFISWLLRFSEKVFPLATFLNQCESTVLDNISEGFYSLHSRNLSMCLFRHNSQLLWHLMTFLCFTGRSDKQRELKRKGTDWKPEAFTYYLAIQFTFLMGLGWTMYYEQKHRNSYLFRTSIPF